jgi:hypothetical protein
MLRCAAPEISFRDLNALALGEQTRLICGFVLSSVGLDLGLFNKKDQII